MQTELITITESECFIGCADIIEYQDISNVKNSDTYLKFNLLLGDYVVNAFSTEEILLTPDRKRIEMTFKHTQTDLSLCKEVSLGFLKLPAPHVMFDMQANQKNWIVYGESELMGIDLHGEGSNLLAQEFEKLDFEPKCVYEDYFTVPCSIGISDFATNLVRYLNKLHGTNVVVEQRRFSTHENLWLRLYSGSGVITKLNSSILKGLSEDNKSQRFEVIAYVNSQEQICGFNLQEAEVRETIIQSSHLTNNEV